MPESEKTTEKYLKEQVEKLDGIAYKWVSPGRIGVPDRICVFPLGLLVFVEVKSEGQKPNQHQDRELARLVDRGFIVTVVDTKKRVDEMITTVKSVIEGLQNRGRQHV